MSALPKSRMGLGSTAFRLWSGAGESWFVEGPGDCCGGIFISREAAVAFIRRECRVLEEMSRHARFQPRPGADPPATGSLRLVHG